MNEFGGAAEFRYCEPGLVIERLAFLLVRNHGFQHVLAVGLARQAVREVGPPPPDPRPWFLQIILHCRELAEANDCGVHGIEYSLETTMLPIEIACPHCRVLKSYQPQEYTGEFLLCRSCIRMVDVSEFYPQASPEARRAMWLDPGMRPYLRRAGMAEGTYLR